MTCVDRTITGLCAVVALCGFPDGFLGAQEVTKNEKPPPMIVVEKDAQLESGIKIFGDATDDAPIRQNITSDKTLLNGSSGLPPWDQQVFVSEYWLGLQCSPAVPSVLRSHLNLREKEGVLIDWVMPESPAAKSGVEQYDVILKLDDTVVASVEEIVKKVDATKDKEITVTLIRHGKPTEVKVKPGKRPESAKAMLSPRQNGTFRSVHPGVIFDGDVVPAQDVPDEIKQMIEQMQRRMQQMQPGMTFDRTPFAVPLERPGSVAGGNMLQVTIEPGRDGQPGKLTVRKNDQIWTAEKLEALPENVQKDVAEMLKNTADGKNVADWIAEQMAEGRRISVSVSVMGDGAPDDATNGVPGNSEEKTPTDDK